MAVNRYRRFTKETIGFQKDGFGDMMTTQYAKLRDYIKDHPEMSREQFLKGPGKDMSAKLSEMVSARFGLNIKFVFNTDSYGAIFVFPVNKNSVLINSVWQSGWSDHKDPSWEFLLKTFQNKKGTVDNNKARVGGIFSEYKHRLIINIFDYFKKDILEPGEVTAITLHELGHAFTYYSMSDRLERTNRVMVDLSNNLKNGGDMKEREYIYKELSDSLHLTEKEANDLITEGSRVVVGNKLFKAYIGSVKSQLPASQYTDASSEQLADDFATKMGYGRQLVSGLDKISSWSPEKSPFVYGLFFSMSFFFTFVFLPAIVMSTFVGSVLGFYLYTLPFLLWYIGWVFSAGDNTKDMTYDILKERYQRVRNQMVESLNHFENDPEELKETLKGIEFVDRAIDAAMKYETLTAKIINFIYSPARSVKEDVELQRLIEDMSYNNLFVNSAKLRTLQ